MQRECAALLLHRVGVATKRSADARKAADVSELVRWLALGMSHMLADLECPDIADAAPSRCGSSCCACVRKARPPDSRVCGSESR